MTQGFVLTTHYNNYDIIYKCLNNIYNNIDIPIDEYHIVLYVNETTCEKVRNIKESVIINTGKKMSNLETIYIDNQNLNNGLTGTWNQGIEHLINKNCSVITILGHDSYINETYNIILKLAQEAQDNLELKYFGPLCKSQNKTDIALGQDYEQYKNHVITYLTGFCMTFPICSLIKNKFCNNMYFDIKFPFAGNEVDWYKRFKRINGIPILCTNVYIEHEHARSWLNHSSYNNKPKTDAIQNKIKELSFDWESYLTKNIDLQLDKTIKTERNAFVHYMTIGRYQNRQY